MQSKATVSDKAGQENDETKVSLIKQLIFEVLNPVPSQEVLARDRNHLFQFG